MGRGRGRATAAEDTRICNKLQGMADNDTVVLVYCNNVVLPVSLIAMSVRTRDGRGSTVINAYLFVLDTFICLFVLKNITDKRCHHIAWVLKKI